MSDPTKPTPNDEKFKPKNVQELGNGRPGTEGRQERNMQDTPRGSEPETRNSSNHRG